MIAQADYLTFLLGCLNFLVLFVVLTVQMNKSDVGLFPFDADSPFYGQNALANWEVIGGFESFSHRFLFQFQRSYSFCWELKGKDLRNLREGFAENVSADVILAYGAFSRDSS